ncbi:cytochrome P450 [Pseudonocardia spinosispora]|uniref:cytochrome P450 n=1 Tax=Pseudonocardia spinosispora TaxID=103441 RepID=UPI00042A9040|nr:cytochrome P450 [Pseudonocardia spinosispora]
MTSTSQHDERHETGTDDPFLDFDHFTSLCLDEDPVPRLHEMRERCPVGRSETHGGSWVLTRYEDVWNAARDSASFSSASGVSVPAHGMPALPPIEYDPPVHTLFRGPLISRFSPSAIARHEPHARDVVNGLVDEFIETGHGDLAQQLTVPLPAIVNTPILGIPVDDRERFQQWVVTLMSSGGQDVAAIQSCMAYFDQLHQVRTREPLDDIPSLLLGIEIDGEPISRQQFVLAMIMLMSGGLDTTTNSGAHMLYHLGRHPEQRRMLVEHPERIPTAIEELLRHITPLPSLFRTTTRDTTLHGQTILEGDRVQLCWMAANHDPAEFPEPDEVRLDRKPNRHLSFGMGAHRCLGAALARMELKVLLEETLPRLGDYRIEQPPTRYSSATRGINNLLVSFTPGARVGGARA